MSRHLRPVLPLSVIAWLPIVFGIIHFWSKGQ